MWEWNNISPTKKPQTEGKGAHIQSLAANSFSRRDRGLQTDILSTLALQPARGLGNVPIHQYDKQTSHLRARLTCSRLEKCHHLITEAQEPQPASYTWTEASPSGDSVLHSEHPKQMPMITQHNAACPSTQGPPLRGAGI